VPAEAPVAPVHEIALSPSGSDGYAMTVLVNQTEIVFRLDTGADTTCISKENASSLMDDGSLSRDDFIGVKNYENADGSVSRSLEVKLREVVIANYVLHDVEAGVACPSPLLGQNILKHFKGFSVNNARSVLVLGEPREG
jgi:clan AA aspartic protease (TIGR02281 family)